MIGNIKFALAMVIQNSPLAVCTVLAISLLTGAVAPVPLLLVKHIVDAVAGTAFSAADNGAPVVYIVLLAAYYCTSVLLGGISSIYSAKLGNSLGEAVSIKLHKKTSGLALSAFDNPSVHNIIYRTHEESLFKPVAIFGGLVGSVNTVAMYLSVMALVASCCVSIIFIVIITGLPLLFLNVKYNKKRFNQEEDLVEKNLKSMHMGRILSTKDYAAEVRLFGAEKYLISALQELRIAVLEQVMKLFVSRTIAVMCARFTAIAGLIASIFIVVKGTLTGAITAGGLVMIIMAVQKLQGATAEIYKELSAFHSDAMYAGNIKRLCEMEGEDRLYKEPTPHSPPPGFKYIDIQSLGFEYLGSQRPILEDICQKFERGNIYVICGKNGSGKSTLLKILAGLYQPTSGSLYIDGFPAKNFLMKSYRSSLAAVMQDYNRYHLGVGDNVFFGWQEQKKGAEVRKTLELVNLMSELEKSSADLRTPIGRMYEDGIELSGGQWKKLALARALYRREARMLLLDEPFNEVDQQTRDKITTHLIETKKERITIIATHDENVLQIADCILKIEAGRLSVHGGKPSKTTLQQNIDDSEVSNGSSSSFL